MSWTKIETADQALELLERAVATRGEDFVYEKPEDAEFCVYVRDGKPDCLIGVVLSMVGWTNEELEVADSIGTVSTLAIDTRWADRFSKDAVRILGSAQSAQDFGRAWGSALAKAREYAAQLPA